MRLSPTAPSVGLAAFVFAVYVAGACRSIYVGDSGELVAAVHTLGIPHPSGYPLYVMLGKLWTLLVPLGSIAFRMSLFSAACAAAACGLLDHLLRRQGLQPIAAALASLLFAFSPSFWGEANIQRVYALNALFVALVTAQVLAWHRTRRRATLLLAAISCGLGATNHTFMAVYGVALAVFVLASEPALLRRPRTLLATAGAGAAGLMPYAYLPLRSLADPVLDWGNPDSPGRLLAVVLRRDFWVRRWIESPVDLVPITLDYLRSLGAELLWLGVGLALVGLVAGRRRGWPVLLPVLGMAANLAAVALHGSRSDIFIWHRYYIPSYLLASLLVGMGCHVFLERLPKARYLVLALPVLALANGYREFDRSRYHIAEDFSRTLLQTLPPGAHLTASDDNVLFVLIYLHLVEGARPDLDLILEGVGGADLPPLRFDPDRDPLFLTHHPNWQVQGLDVLPVGLAFQTVRSGTPAPPPRIPKWRLDGEDDPRVPKDYLTRNLIGHFHYMLGVSHEALDWPTAQREFDAAAGASPDNDVLFYNLGLIYRRNGLLREALAAFERSDRLNPRAIASTSRALARERIRELQPEVAELDRVEREILQELRSPHPPGTAAYHEALAEAMTHRGLTLPARGHALRAAVLHSRER